MWKVTYKLVGKGKWITKSFPTEAEWSSFMKKLYKEDKYGENIYRYGK